MKTRLETIEFAAGDQRLAGTFLAPAAVLPGILFVHGWGGSQEQDLDRARQAAGLGCTCLTFDLRGHERTLVQRESVTRQENLDDLLAAYDVLTARPGVDKDSIAVVAISYGGYLACILSSLRPVRWLALRAPALYPDAGWDLPKRALNRDPGLAEYRMQSIAWKDNRALNACAMFRGDVLVVESEHDTLVPHPVIENYVNAFVKPRSTTARVIAGADHALSDEKHQRDYTALLINWLTEMIVGARAHEAAKTTGQPVTQGAALAH
jgi:pimeloyl-ACP methyl ester carboxylesterase